MPKSIYHYSTMLKALFARAFIDQAGGRGKPGTIVSFLVPLVDYIHVVMAVVYARCLQVERCQSACESQKAVTYFLAL